MKTKSIAAVICVWLCGIFNLVAAQPSVIDQQQAVTGMQALADGRNYTINIIQALPLRGTSIATNMAVLRVDGDKVYSALPYWGSGYNTFSSDNGMRFTGTISDYAVKIGKKDKVVVTFKATADTGWIYQFRIEIFYNASTFVSILCANLDPMRYTGTIGLSDQAE